MSISPLCGHSPYVLLTGKSQIAGHNQSPVGSIASTSTRPYLITAPFLVSMRPLLTGLTIVLFVVLVLTIQSDQRVEEQMPDRVRLMTLLCSMRLLFWRVGMM